MLQEEHYYPFGLGQEGPFYPVQYDAVVARWGSVDPSAESFLSISPYHYGYNNPIVTIDPDGRHNIVVGSQYDGSAGNKLMFVNQEVRSMRLWSENQKDETRTMVLFSGGYSEEQISAIRDAVEGF